MGIVHDSVNRGLEEYLYPNEHLISLFQVKVTDTGQKRQTTRNSTVLIIVEKCTKIRKVLGTISATNVEWSANFIAIFAEKDLLKRAVSRLILVSFIKCSL